MARARRPRDQIFLTSRQNIFQYGPTKTTNTFIIFYLCMTSEIKKNSSGGDQA